MRYAALLLVVSIVACKKEVPLATCPSGTVNVDGVCRVSCAADADCLYAEACLDGVCMPRLATEGPKVRLFRPDQIMVTRTDPTVHFDYVVTNASSVELSPMPGGLSEHAGTLEVTLADTTEFTLFGRAGDREDSATQLIQVVDGPPDGELLVGMTVARSETEPCEAVDVQWTILGDFDEGSLEVWIEADGNEVFRSDQDSALTTLPLDGPKVLKMFARAGELEGSSTDLAARPSMLCRVRTSPPDAAVQIGDTVLIEWETKGAAVVLVEEEGGARLYTHPVLDRDSRRIGRWLLTPLVRHRYRIVAVAPDQQGTEELEVEVDVTGELPPPLVDTFSVTPEWFGQALTDLEITWGVTGGAASLSMNDMNEPLPTPRGTTIRQAATTTELVLHAERNGSKSQARKLVWSSMDEQEPNDDRTTANPLQINSGQSGSLLVARTGVFQLLQVQDVDWYGIEIGAGALRVRIFDPLQLDCASLTGAVVSVDREGDVFHRGEIAGGCPAVVLGGIPNGNYRISVEAPPDAIGTANIGYVIAADPAPIACGDGVVEWREACDDGNQSGGDGCNATCALEPGYSYELQTFANPSVPPPVDPQPLAFRPYRAGEDGLDEGFAIVPADVHYFGHRYAGLMIHVNGYVTLLPDIGAGAGLGSPLSPNAVIAGFGADLRHEAGSSVVYSIEETPDGLRHLIDYRQMHGADGNGVTIGPIDFRIAIAENGEIRFYYDPANQVPESFSWVGGIEDATGRYAHPVKGCADFCSGAPADLENAFIPR